MRLDNTLPALLLVAVPAVQGAALQRRSASETALTQGSSNSTSPFCLDASLLQSASNLTGQEKGTIGLKPGQSASEIDAANFINFCRGHELTNGRQLSTSSCNGIPMGRLPAKSNMIASIITAPSPGGRIAANADFNVTVQTTHLSAGHLANPTTNYYTAPQDLDANGNVLGHCHITIQALPVAAAVRKRSSGASSAAHITPPDPSHFVFFKGVDDAGNGQGLLQTTVSGGLPAGWYRVCTMIAARNHQPVTMPVAQRGAQDDCVRFQVFANDEADGEGANNSGAEYDG